MASKNALQPPSPAGSQFSAMNRTSSHESLTAHPLLVTSPATASPPVGSPTAANSSASGSTTAAPPKYLPYTPRQRVPTSSATTGTTVSSPVSVSPHTHHLGGATSKLQLQNLKAITQNNGLDAASLGWAMLEEIIMRSDQGAAWDEIWNTLAIGKATLLLPTEHVASKDLITPEFLRDHIVFCNGTARNDTPFVTLSGLRGIIGEHLTFRGTVATSSKTYKSLSSPPTRASALSALPPLPSLSAYVPPFPEIQISTSIPSLPFPPRSFSQKPPLPPRPGARVTSGATSRISNPFASFFGKSSAPPSPSLPPTTDVPQEDHGFEIAAVTIDRPVIRRTVAKALSKSFKTEIKDSLTGLPSWLVDRTQSFSENLLPFPKTQRSSSRDSSSTENGTLPYSVSAVEEFPEEVEGGFQSFYESLEHDLRTNSSPTARRKDEHHDDKEKDARDNDARIRDTMEQVERVLCCTFYDRLFRQSTSDDASHDAALSSRVAALNMLDLTLDHLGVDVGSSAIEINEIVAACGQTISQLEVAQCPADKGAILVAAHRIIVDGLSRLPPVRLKSENVEDDKTPMATKFGDDAQPSANRDTYNANIDPPAMVPPEGSTEGSDEHSREPSVISELNLSPAVETPLLTVSPPPKEPTPVSGDVLLPLLIFAVVKSNPPQLVSHLLYTQRFRNRSVGGEESYCLVNLMAVVEFLENVDLAALGLKESESKVMSTADLTPIPVAQTALVSEKSTAHAGLRGRVEQQVDAIAGSANKVFTGVTGVVDTGFGVLRSLLPMNNDGASNSEHAVSDTESAPWNASRPGFGLLRRQSGFSIASIAASLPGGRERSRSMASTHRTEEEGQEMVESRPGSIRSFKIGSTTDQEESSSEHSADGSDDDDDDENPAQDARSIRSFESMLSGRGKRHRSEKLDKKERMSLSDRLASMSRLTRGTSAPQPIDIPTNHKGSPPPRTSSLQAVRGSADLRYDSPVSSRSESPVKNERALQLAPPNRHFLECTADDLKMSEIPHLLAEYRRLVEGIQAVGGFEEPAK